MDTILDFKIQTFDVVGRGGLVSSPRQIGEWWVMPIAQYKKQIPADALQKMADFKATGTPYLGFLIADDMTEIRHQRELEEKKRELQKQKIAQWTSVAVAIAAGLGMAMLMIARVALTIDPMLIAVLPDGRWVCLASWYD